LAASSIAAVVQLSYLNRIMGTSVTMIDQSCDLLDNHDAAAAVSRLTHRT
jgi:hypothetical protein